MEGRVWMRSGEREVTSECVCPVRGRPACVCEHTCSRKRDRGAALGAQVSVCLPVCQSFGLFRPVSLPQREPALGLQCFWWLWAQHFVILLVACLSRPQRGQMEPVEGERQSVMLG